MKSTECLLQAVARILSSGALPPVQLFILCNDCKDEACLGMAERTGRGEGCLESEIRRRYLHRPRDRWPFSHPPLQESKLESACLRKI